MIITKHDYLFMNTYFFVYINTNKQTHKLPQRSLAYQPRVMIYVQLDDGPAFCSTRIGSGSGSPPRIIFASMA